MLLGLGRGSGQNGHPERPISVGPMHTGYHSAMAGLGSCGQNRSVKMGCDDFGSLGQTYSGITDCTA